jgi:hypothetical protein
MYPNPTVTNGSHITGPLNKVSVNGICNPLTQAGADLGAQVNSCMATMPNGGKVEIPAGTYSYTTTIQCPITNFMSYIIEGAGSSGATAIGVNNTTLYYTGNGDAINQFVTNISYQNSPGCQLRDFNLEGNFGGPAANGYHFGGTENSRVSNVTIARFGGAGILLENSITGEWTERYDLEGMLWNNGIGISLVADTGGSPSFAHGYIKEWFNTGNSQIGIQINGNTGYDSASISSSYIRIDGNFGTGTGTTATVWKVLNGGFVQTDDISEGQECQGTSCIEANVVDVNSQFNSLVNFARGGGDAPTAGNWNYTGAGLVNYLPMSPPAEHFITTTFPVAVAGNQFNVFPPFLPTPSAYRGGPLQFSINCTFSGSCTTYPSFDLFDLGAAADVAGAGVTCAATSTVANKNHYALSSDSVHHLYTVRSNVGAVGCTGTIPFTVTVDEVW